MALFTLFTFVIAVIGHSNRMVQGHFHLGDVMGLINFLIAYSLVLSK